ncbi:dihydrolipoamide acetyltransferase family protein [Foetidibacter luteolus]|uniref:dihydrolipoamide acetyltransferase family protein n=1 Tax=Foetidibacter luteolus TaxID=2608880 RepID=UPI00129B8FB8|nr:dihydrolipoamide acetyltransferase family protein [Foetidibacter luteolus]
MALVDLVMPKLGESIVEATILKWLKKPGDSVQQDETVLEIATDKVDSEVPSTVAGTISEILFNVNDVVPIGSVIARIETEVSVAAQPALLPDEDAGIEDLEEITMAVPYQPTPTVHVPAGSNRFYSPLVLNIANSEGIALSELEKIPGSGNEGRVTKKDILEYVESRKNGSANKVAEKVSPQAAADAPAITTDILTQPKAQPAKQPEPAQPAVVSTEVATVPKAGSAESNVEVIEMDRMRKMIARHMVDSKHTSAHVTSFAEADVTNMVLWREKVKKDFEKRENTKITFTPLFIDCLVRVMKRYPLINSSVDGERIIVKKDINIGMATALQNGNLIVPVIRNADYLNLVGLSKSVNTLADNARNNRLKPDDTQGGTFTLTNVGTFGSLMGTPIINQPQVAILAVGAIKKRPVVIETEQGDTIGIRHMMYLSLSYDHRIIDGSLGASFLTAVAREFEQWDINRNW